MITKVERLEGCIGCGNCVRHCPNIFQINHDGKSEVISSSYQGNHEEINKAEKSCPVKVIKVSANNTNKASGNLNPSRVFFDLRKWHFYSSVLGSLLFLFFAFTGLLANRPEFYQRNILQKIPHSIQLKKDELIGWFKAYDPNIAELKSFEQDSENYFFTFIMLNKTELQIELDLVERHFSSTFQHKIPPQYEALEDQDLILLISQKLSGKINTDSIESDEETLYFSYESVWVDYSIAVDKVNRIYTIEKDRSHWVDSLINLHRGKGASKYQTLLIDLSGILLFFCYGFRCFNRFKVLPKI